MVVFYSGFDDIVIMGLMLGRIIKSKTLSSSILMLLFSKCLPCLNNNCCIASIVCIWKRVCRDHDSDLSNRNVYCSFQPVKLCIWLYLSGFFRTLLCVRFEAWKGQFRALINMKIIHTIVLSCEQQ